MRRSYKLELPDTADQIARPGLVTQLSTAHRRAPVTWVVGLPGSGKSSLVASWCRRLASPVVWYRVESDDAAAASWIDAVVQQLAPARGALPSWSPENQGELIDFARPFFAELARRPLTLVLDDCHRLSDDASLLSMFTVLHEVCGRKLRVILISRRQPTPELAHGITSGWLELVDDLRLRPREVEQLVRAAGRSRLTAAEREALLNADGWLAHVLALCRRPASAAQLSNQSGAVGDFLAAELLASVPVLERAGLRRLAELPEIPADGRWVAPEVSSLLATLSSQRYFVELVRGRYRLHDLLRDGLLRLNAAQDPPERLSGVRRELAGWIEALMPEAAMKLRAAAADTQGALRLLEAHGASWLSRGLHQTVGSWLNQLPPPADPAATGALAFWRAQAFLPLEPEKARPLFAAARRNAADAARAYGAWCGEVDSYVIQWGAVFGLADLVDELEVLQAKWGPPPGDLRFRTGAAALTALMYGRAEDPRIVHFADETANAVTHAPDAGARISAAAQLLIYRMWWAGDFPGGRALYDTFDDEVSEGEHLDALPRLLWWSCAAIVDWQCGKPEDCHAKVERGLALAASTGVHVRDFFLLTQGIFCSLSQEDWPRAEAYLARLARTERQHRRLDVMVHHFFRSWYSLSRGDALTAKAHADAAWSVAEAIGSMFHKVIALSALGPALVHCGDLDGAERAYRAQLVLAKAANNPTFSFIAFCAGAELALARNDEAALAKQVERILLVKQMAGFHSTCGWRTSMMTRVFSFALQRRIYPEIARRWIQERALPPPGEPVPGWPRPVQVEAFDGLEVRFFRLGHAQHGDGGRAGRKLRELLAVLVAVKRGATQAELGDWLWPDSDGDRASTALKVSIHRLRQWLGAEAVRVADGRVSLNPALVDCDLWQPSRPSGPGAARVLHGFDAPPIQLLRASLQQAR